MTEKLMVALQDAIFAAEIEGSVNADRLVAALIENGYTITERPAPTMAERDAARKLGHYYVRKNGSATVWVGYWTGKQWALMGHMSNFRSVALRSIDERRLEDLAPPKFGAALDRS